MKKVFSFFCFCVLLSCGPDPRADGRKIGELRCKVLEYHYKFNQTKSNADLQKYNEASNNVQEFYDDLKKRFDGNEKEFEIIMRTCDTLVLNCPYYDLVE